MLESIVNQLYQKETPTLLFSCYMFTNFRNSRAEHLFWGTFFLRLLLIAVLKPSEKHQAEEPPWGVPQKNCSGKLHKIHTKGSFIKKETLAQLFSWEPHEISKNTFFTEHLWTTAFVQSVTKITKINFHSATIAKSIYFFSTF